MNKTPEPPIPSDEDLEIALKHIDLSNDVEIDPSRETVHLAFAELQRLRKALSPDAVFKIGDRALEWEGYVLTKSVFSNDVPIHKKTGKGLPLLALHLVNDMMLLVNEAVDPVNYATKKEGTRHG